MIQLIGLLMAASFLSSPWACAPDLTGTRWRCAEQTDCVEGWVCNQREGYCEPATVGTEGIFDDRLVFGMSAPITTGPVELGIGMQSGIESFFAHINRAGGIHNRRVELMALNDGYEPDAALQNTQDLVGNRRVFASIGNVGTPTAQVTVPYVVEHRSIFFGAYTGAGLLRKDPPDRYVFNYRASYREETEAVVKYFTSVREPAIPPQNIWVLPQGENSNGTLDAYGQSGFDGVAAALKTNFGISASDISFETYQRNTLDVANAVTAFLQWLGNGQRTLSNGRHQAMVVMVPTAEPAAAFIKAVLDEVGFIKSSTDAAVSQFGLTMAEMDEIRKSSEIVFSSVSFVGSNRVAEVLKAYGTYEDPENGARSYCSGVIVTQVVPFYNGNSTVAIEYRDDFMAYDSNLQPGFVSMEGYLVARLMVEGLRRHGRDLTVESLVNTLESLDGVDLGTGELLGFSAADHQASHRVFGSMLNDDCLFVELGLTP